MKKLVIGVIAVVVIATGLFVTKAWADGCIGCDGFYEASQPSAAQGDVIMPEINIPVTVQIIRPVPHRVIVVTTPVVQHSTGGSVWDSIAACESGGNWASTDGGFEGGVQFLHSTWVSAGGRKYAEHAYQATREQQIEIADAWRRQTSWSQWPACSSKLGLR